MMEDAEDGFDDGAVFGETAGADHATGKIAAVRGDDADVASGEDFKIGLGRGVVPHIDVHRRSNDDGRGGGEDHGGEEVVGEAVGHFGEDVGGGGGDDEGVGGLRSVDVLDCGEGVALGGSRVGASGAQRPVMTLWPVREAKVSGWMKCWAAAVMTTCTSRACFCRSRTSSADL